MILQVSSDQGDSVNVWSPASGFARALKVGESQDDLVGREL